MIDFSRQSFLGPNSEEIFANAVVGVVGYGGGGSHIGQQLGHVGIGKLVVVDPDTIEQSNRNRLVGSTDDDVDRSVQKVCIARRQINRANPNSRVLTFWANWQTDDALHALRNCDIIFGAVDSFQARAQLEDFCRVNLIPYIDIGMKVSGNGERNYKIRGHVFCSMPGGPCIKCCNVIKPSDLTRDRGTYGEVGLDPQVIWPNGVLASAAVGIGISLLCPWYKMDGLLCQPYWLTYDGNTGELQRPPVADDFAKIAGSCRHYQDDRVGDPVCNVEKFSYRRPDA